MRRPSSIQRNGRVARERVEQQALEEVAVQGVQVEAGQFRQGELGHVASAVAVRRVVSNGVEQVGEEAGAELLRRMDLRQQLLNELERLPGSARTGEP